MAESPTTSSQFQPLVFWHHLPSLSQKEDTPVIGVSWYEAAYFVNVLRSLSEQELCFEHRVAPKYSKEILDTDIVDPLPLIDTLHGRVDYEALSGWKLPTEKEWLYACQGGGDTPFYGCLDEIAWHKENNEEGELKRVNQKKPNPFGLFDMLGNMFEWVYDACEPKYVCQKMDGRLVECFKRSIGAELYLAKAKDYRDLLSCDPADFRGPKQGFRVIKAI